MNPSRRFGGVMSTERKRPAAQQPQASTHQGFDQSRRIQTPYSHLDPSCDPPEHYLAAFDLCCELWGELCGFRSSYRQDPFLMALVSHLESQLVGAAVILRTKLEVNEDE